MGVKIGQITMQVNKAPQEIYKGDQKEFTAYHLIPSFNQYLNVSFRVLESKNYPDLIQNTHKKIPYRIKVFGNLELNSIYVIIPRDIVIHLSVNNLLISQKVTKQFINRIFSKLPILPWVIQDNQSKREIKSISFASHKK